VILAIQFMRNAVRDSHARWEPDTPIQLEPFAGEPDSPSTFAVDFLLASVRYQYGFSLGPEAVLEEWLYAYPSGKKQTWFARERNKPISFSAKLQGDNRTIERLTRPNSLFLSAAAQNNHEALSPVYRWFSGSLAIVAGSRSMTFQGRRTMLDSAELRREFARLLASADLGITALNVEEVRTPELSTGFVAKMASLIETEFPQADLRRRIQFLHRVGDATLPLSEIQESQGTLAYLCLLEPVLESLGAGGVVCVDELDQSLHPLLAIQLIRQFSETKNNPASAQMIFNTHDTNLLSGGALRRDQIWFTEKRRDGESQLYPLTDFKPRRQENLENGYLQGRYGAIPFLNADWVFKDGNEERR
jgi:hypothetical protein